MSPNAPLTDKQRGAVIELRAMYKKAVASVALGTARSLEQRAQLPDPKSLQTGVTVHVEIAPPSPQPHPLLDSNVLKTPEPVPVYFFALRNEQVDSGSNANSEPVNTRVIFFVHGGGNLAGHPTDPPNIDFFTQLLRAVDSRSANGMKCVLIAPSYRLATVPENVFPAAVQDVVAAYNYVLGKGYSASNIYIAGDSVGGNDALVLTHLTLQSNMTPPPGIIAIAPYSIQAFDSSSEYAKAQVDIFDLSAYETMGRLCVGDSGVSLTDPLVSGAFLPFEASWPRTLILVGTADRLIDASREVEKRLAALGRPVELVEYQERPHLWWILPHIFPENVQDAVERIARFVFH